MLYLCAPAAAEPAVIAALAGGVDRLQLRDDAADLETAVRWRELAHAAGADFYLNDRAGLARAAGADGVHLGQDDGEPLPGQRYGRSTHAPEQIDTKADYLSVGPVWATPTKPGRAATGLDYVRWAAANVTQPWFAIGGIDLDNVHEVIEAGATRIVVVRALLEADDPEAAARAFKEILERA